MQIYLVHVNLYLNRSGFCDERLLTNVTVANIFLYPVFDFSVIRMYIWAIC